MEKKKRVSTIKKNELVKELNWLERKNKRNNVWDNKVKLAFNNTGSYSFEELVIKNNNRLLDQIIIFQYVENVMKNKRTIHQNIF